MHRLLEGTWGAPLLPEHILLELVTVLAARLGLRAAVDFGQTLPDARELEIVRCSELLLGMFDLFRQQTGGSLSLADAAIVAIARRRQATHAATLDTGFEDQEGFVVVPSGGTTY